jgi:hypothetical protein
LHEAFNILLVELGHLLDFKTAESFPKAFSPFQNCDPGQSSLEALQTDSLK